VEALVDKSYKNFVDKLNDALKVKVFVNLCPVIEKLILVYNRVSDHAVRNQANFLFD